MPVTLPPGLARLWTRPVPTGSFAIVKTMGMTNVAFFKVATAVPFAAMTSTLRRTNSAAISASRSGRPSDQRYSISTVRPSIQLSSRSRATNAAVHGPKTEAFAPRYPIVGSFPACWALAASGQTAAPLTILMNSRRLMASPEA